MYNTVSRPQYWDDKLLNKSQRPIERLLKWESSQSCLTPKPIFLTNSIKDDLGSYYSWIFHCFFVVSYNMWDQYLLKDKQSTHILEG